MADPSSRHRLILHHYQTSPFSEKIRLILGAKRLAWHSVKVPMVMPKPDLTALTGGYRRTPVLQIGADVYCDTALIARVLDRLAPQPALFAEPSRAARTVAGWADRDLFGAAMAWCFQAAGREALFRDQAPEQVEAFNEDRRRMREGGAFVRMNAGDAAGALHDGLARVGEHLADGRQFLLAQTLTIADFSVYHPLWFIAGIAPVAGILDQYPAIRPWMARMASFGPGEFTVMGAPEAIDVARSAGSIGSAGSADSANSANSANSAGEQPRGPGADPGPWVDHHGLPAGARVRIMANDYALDPVIGELVVSGPDHLAVRRSDPRAGLVTVHFPRLGYTLKAA